MVRNLLKITNMPNSIIQSYLEQIKLPNPYSHKGQNGKVLLIGGSELFHSASRWCLDTVAHFVDMVFYCSVPSNNELIKEAKSNFWNGIVVNRQDCESYLKEADVVVIGPGMERTGELLINQELEKHIKPLSEQEWNFNTSRIVNYLLAKYPEKKWVVDAGALQMADPSLYGKKMILTPHQQELERLEGLISSHKLNNLQRGLDWLLEKKLTILLKGQMDNIYWQNNRVEVAGGNAGLTKGGTGDVLAGLVAGLYAGHDAVTASVVASFINKQAGEDLWKSVGPFFTATDLVNQVPKTLWSVLEQLNQSSN